MYHGRRRAADPPVAATRKDDCGDAAAADRVSLLETLKHEVTATEAGSRCDVTIARISGASRGLVANAMRAGLVHLNGEVPKPAMPVAEGDVIEYSVPARAVLETLPEDIALSIAYEDDDLLVVDKPAGMVTHPAHGARDGTLANALVAYAGTLPGDALRPGLVHRLDRDTSGLLVVAKTEEALSTLGKMMMRRAIDRTYLGIVVGELKHPKGTIDGALGRDPTDRLKYAIRVDGKPAVTHYSTSKRLIDASELQFVLETGRTHQIRVHMAALGNPIFNDPVYGKVDKRVDLPGQALHAWKLGFKHPRTGEPLAFESPPPADYVAARDLLTPRLG